MKLTGGRYCKDVRYQIEGEAQAALHCHCRECQYISGGKQTFHHIPDGIPAFDKRSS